MAPGNGSFLTQFIFDGIKRTTRSPAPPFLPVPKNVCGHCNGELELDNLNSAEFTSAYPHVLFPL